MRFTERQTGGAAILEADAESVRQGGVSVARFAGFDAGGRFLVELAHADEPAIAVSTVALESTDVGAAVVVADSDVGRPIIMGRVHERASPPLSGVKVDGARLVIRAEQEIELQCGDASVTLTRTGKVLIRGNYVLTRSRGANKIKGAFVEIN